MRSFFYFLLINIFFISFAKTQTENALERKGFIFGTAPGISTMNLTFSNFPAKNHTSASFPNFKIGGMVNSRTAIVLSLPGTIYKFNHSGRKRDRGFESIIPAVQYWIKDRWWVIGGIGLTQDAPAFYDIKDDSERKFYFGPGLLMGTGYELLKKGTFTIDIQGRIHAGYANISSGNVKGAAFSFLIGFNWY